MTASKREIIYIDVEDEITSVIDKVVSAKSKILGLVPPKRATMLQSVVNMKLLKRSADQAGKKIVLVTSETSLLPLAGVCGIHVAKNLQSKPYIPDVDEVPQPESNTEPTPAEQEPQDEDFPTEDESLVAEEVPEEAAVGAKPEAKAKLKSKDKKSGPKIPNFDSFRSKLLLVGGGLVGLIVVWFILFKVLPKSTVTIKADTTQITVAETITASTGDEDLEKAVLSSSVKTATKALTQTFTPSGQKNVGDKAKGVAVFTNCNKEDKLSDTTITIPAGTTISNGDKSFVTASDVNVEPSSYSGNNCQANKPSAAVDVTAANAGDQYNLSGRTYSVAGFTSVTAAGGQMSGGTTKNVQVVSDADVEQAKQKLAAQDVGDLKKQLAKDLGDDYVVIEDSFSANVGQPTVAPAVGQEAASATLSATNTYTLLGVKKTSLRNFLQERAKKEFDSKTQKVYEDGVDEATLTVDKKVSDSNYQLKLDGSVFVGPHIDESELAKAISGKRIGEAEELIKERPGVRDVKVTLNPFYTRSLPKPGKITITFDVESSKPRQ